MVMRMRWFRDEKFDFLFAVVICLSIAAFVAGQIPTRSAVAGQDSGLDVQAETLVVYSAKWCGPCQIMAPTLARLKREGYDIVVYDVDKLASGEQTDVHKVRKYRSVPELVWLNGRSVVRQEIGRKSRREILRTLVKPGV